MNYRTWFDFISGQDCKGPKLKDLLKEITFYLLVNMGDTFAVPSNGFFNASNTLVRVSLEYMFPEFGNKDYSFKGPFVSCYFKGNWIIFGVKETVIVYVLTSEEHVRSLYYGEYIKFRKIWDDYNTTENYVHPSIISYLDGLVEVL